MKKIVFTRADHAELVEIADRSPAPGEVRLKLAFSALSAGTERAVLTGNPDGGDGFRSGFPSSSGYSGSGVVLEVGEGVSDFCPGDRVMVHGAGHQQYSTLPTKELVKLPDSVSLLTASQIIIAGFSLAAVRKTRIALGESGLVVGLGLLGLFALPFMRLSGAYPLIAADLDPERRAHALRMGADHALDPASPDYADEVKKLTGGGANAVIEVTGNPKALKTALSCTARFGRVALLGCTRTMTEVDFYHDVHRPGIELIGAHSGARPVAESHSGVFTEMDDCRVILAGLDAKRFDFSPMISEVVSPADAPAVYARLAEAKDFPVGVVFDWNRLG